MNFIPSSQQQGNQEWPIGQNHRYESLTGLLLQENTPTSYNDDDSYKHHPAFGIEEEMNGRRERDEKRRALSLFRRVCHRHDSPGAVLFGLGSIFAVGAMLGLLMPSEKGGSSNSLDWDTISNMLGYTYFLSWTFSFYPQIITNCKRPQDARLGVSIDFLIWNVIGFACYTAYVTCFMYSDVIRKEYADRFGGGGEDVSKELSKLIHHHDVAVNGDNVLSELSSSAGVMGNETAIVDNSTATAPIPDSNTASYNTTTANTDTTDGPMPVPQVKFNDVAFAWHALLLSMITYVQIVWFSKGKDLSTDSEGNEDNISSIECSVRQHQQVGGGYITPQSNDEVFGDVNSSNISPAEGSVLFNEHQQMHLRKQVQGLHEQLDSLVETEHNHKLKLRSQRISCTSKCLMLILLKFCIAGVLLVLVWSRWHWIDYLYFLSFVKVSISIVKYIPQALLNYERKSTSGWQIWNILLDFSGGSLSIIQLIGDSLAEARAQGLHTGWRGVLGNPAKLGLGIVSIFFDIIFLVQHYLLYPSSKLIDNESAPCYPHTPMEDSDYSVPLLADKENDVIVFV